jgi:hypothetical protein
LYFMKHVVAIERLVKTVSFSNAPRFPLRYTPFRQSRIKEDMDSYSGRLFEINVDVVDENSPLLIGVNVLDRFRL